MQSIHLRGGRLLDPRHDRDEEIDIVIEAGKIARIDRAIATPTNAIPVDCRGLLLLPGFVDLHAHLREPGDEGK
ncbi:hypothetical protein BH09MYX1_BH09MYX1_33010 [soil metagenome]